MGAASYTGQRTTDRARRLRNSSASVETEACIAKTQGCCEEDGADFCDYEYSREGGGMPHNLLPLFVGLCIFGVTLLVVVGAASLLFLSYVRGRKKPTGDLNWPTVSAQIMVSRVEETVRSHVEDDVFYYPYIEFEYMAGSGPRRGKQAVGKPCNVEFKAKQTLKAYPVGTTISVRYNPENLDEARLAN
jgi:hypothetical protein